MGDSEMKEADKISEEDLQSLTKALTEGKVEHLSEEQAKKMKQKNLEKILSEPVVRDALEKLSKEQRYCRYKTKCEWINETESLK